MELIKKIQVYLGYLNIGEQGQAFLPSDILQKTIFKFISSFPTFS